MPYYESTADSPTGSFRDFDQVLGPNVTLYRYVYTTGTSGTASARYAVSGPGQTDTLGNLARFKPTNFVTSTLGSGGTTSTDNIVAANPLGLAFFVDLPSPLDVISYGRASTLPIQIPLYEGWNMIGDPFPYPVAFNSLTVVKGANTVPVAKAVDQGVLLPYLYRYQDGSYTFSALPAGDLQPWEGHWIYVNPVGTTLSGTSVATLIVPPTQSGSASRASSAVAKTNVVTGAGSWAIKLEARTKHLYDGNNVIGLTAGNSATTTRTRAPKPPKPAPYVSVGVVGLDDYGTQYAQVLQTTGGTKTWEVAVNSDQTDTDVTVTWPSVQPVPRNYRLTLTDKATGQVLDMRQSASYTFNTGRNAAARSLTITASPASNATRVAFSNIYVNPGGGRGQDVFEIGYTVSQDSRIEVSILALGGRSLATIGGSRAASSGDNKVVWNGKDTSGKPVGAGTYVLQLKAISTDGTVTRETRPFVVTR